jgi:hypothetical protein
MFPQQVEAMFKPKTAAPASPAAPSAASPAPASPGNGKGRRLFVTLDGRRHDVLVETLES